MSSPAAPILKGATDLNYGVPDDGIFVSGNYVYIAEGGGTTNAFEIFDVSNPATPSRVSQSALANSGQPDDIFVSGNGAYIVEGGGTTNAFEIFDILRISAAR